jgi:hypothetical protein
MHYNQYGNWTKLVRRTEEQNFDHPNVQDYMQTYTTRGRDYDVDSKPTTPATATPSLTTNYVDKENDL